jgi:four helix bundle protein
MSDTASRNGSKSRQAVASDMMARTKEFSLRIVRGYELLPKSVAAQVLGKQALRSGTSVGAHYREACRGKTAAEFKRKLEPVLQELEETSYWLELLADGGYVEQDGLADLLAEAKQLAEVLTASGKTSKAKKKVARR